MTRLNTKLAKTIEKRLLETLRRSKYGYMTFGELVKRAKTDRWLELSKHVYGSMAYRMLVESPTAGDVVALRCSIENYIGMTSEMNYKIHLNAILGTTENEVRRIKFLIGETV